MSFVWYQKALLASGAFTLAAVVSLWYQPGSWSMAFPLIIFYAVLVLNTYFSIECFSHIISPEDKLQQGIDYVLAFLYFFLAWNIFDPLRFSLVALALFVVATFKYVLLLGKTNYNIFLRKKIKIDVAGAFGCGLAVLGMFSGFIEITEWIWVGAFTLANVYLLAIRPMYALIEDKKV